MNIDYIIIENNYSEYKKSIVLFISKLDIEKKYCNFTLKRILNAPMLVLAIHDGNIIGVAGNEQKFKIEHYLRIVRTFTIINKNYHGKSIGTQLVQKRIMRTIEKRYNMILSIIMVENFVSRNLIEKMNYKLMGITDNLAYYTYTITKKGFLFYAMLIIIFPFIRLFKKIRR